MFFQKLGFLTAQKYLLVSAKARVFQKLGFLTAQKYLLVSTKTRVFEKPGFLTAQKYFSKTPPSKNPGFNTKFLVFFLVF